MKSRVARWLAVVPVVFLVWAAGFAGGSPVRAADSYISYGTTGHFAFRPTQVLWSGSVLPGWGAGYSINLGLAPLPPNDDPPSYAVWWVCGGKKFDALGGTALTRMVFLGFPYQGDTSATVAGNFTTTVMCSLMLWTNAPEYDIWADQISLIQGAGGYQQPFPDVPPSATPSPSPSATPSPTPTPSASPSPSPTPCMTTIPLPDWVGYVGPGTITAPCATAPPEAVVLTCTTQAGAPLNCWPGTYYGEWRGANSTVVPAGWTITLESAEFPAGVSVDGWAIEVMAGGSDSSSWGNYGDAPTLDFTRAPDRTGSFGCIGDPPGPGVGCAIGIRSRYANRTSGPISIGLRAHGGSGAGSSLLVVVYTLAPGDGAASPSPGGSAAPAACFYPDQVVPVPFGGHVTMPGASRACGPGEAPGTVGQPPYGPGTGADVPLPPGSCRPGDLTCDISTLPGRIADAITNALRGFGDGISGLPGDIANGIGSVVVGDLNGTGTAFDALSGTVHGKVDPFMTGIANAGAGFGAGAAAGGADGGLSFAMPWFNAGGGGLQSQDVTLPTLSNPYRGAMVALMALLFAVALVKLAGRIFGVGGDSE